MMIELFLAGALLLAPPQTSGPVVSQDPVQLEDVVVSGRTLDSLIRDFVGEVAEPNRNRGLARWNRPICVAAVNLRNDVGQYIVDRISDVARELEVEAGEPGCRPNVLIVAADDGAALASAIVEDRPRNFDLRHNGTDAGTRAFRNFRRCLNCFRRRQHLQWPARRLVFQPHLWPCARIRSTLRRAKRGGMFRNVCIDG